MLPVKDGTSEFWRNLFVRCHRFLCSPCSLLERALPGWKAKELRVYTDSKVPQVELTNLTMMHRRHIFKCKLKILLLLTQSWHFTVWLKYSLTVAVFIHKFALLCFTRCSIYTVNSVNTIPCETQQWWATIMLLYRVRAVAKGAMPPPPRKLSAPPRFWDCRNNSQWPSGWVRNSLSTDLRF